MAIWSSFSDAASAVASAAGYHQGLGALQETGLTTGGPDWNKVAIGVNIRSLCHNSDCPANGERVWVQLGIGEFDILHQIYREMVCPNCKERTEDIIALGFRECHYIIRGHHVSGRVADEDRIVIDNFQRYEITDGRWHDLRVTTTKLGEQYLR